MNALIGNEHRGGNKVTKNRKQLQDLESLIWNSKRNVEMDYHWRLLELLIHLIPAYWITFSVPLGTKTCLQVVFKMPCHSVFVEKYPIHDLLLKFKVVLKLMSQWPNSKKALLFLKVYRKTLTHLWQPPGLDLLIK